MTLKTLKLSNFRSYSESEFEFDDNLTAIIGPNGSGKTNILEAIYTLSMTKSFRELPSVMARNGDDWFFVEAGLKNPKEDLRLAWRNGQKELKINETKTLPHEYLGHLPVVLFEPGSLDMVTGSPQLRRNWLDRVLSITDKQYYQALVRYRRVLKQRNSLLRRHGEAAGEQIFAWDIALSEQAEYIADKRLELVEAVDRDIDERYRRISQTKDQISVGYKSNLASDGYRDELLSQLQSRLPNDMRLGSTSVGPHRDDLSIHYNGQSLSQVGSRGENRTATLALIQCELEFIKLHSKRPPVLLLDDVLSELDTKRQQALLSASIEVQTVITSTSLPSNIGEHATIKLKQGR